MIKTSVPFTSHKCESPLRSIETTPSELFSFFRVMATMRCMEIAADLLYKAKLIHGFCHLNNGQEAVIVGMEATITKKDSIIIAYHDHCTFLNFFEFMGLKFCRIVWVAEIFWVYGLLKIVWNFLGCSCVGVWWFFLLLHLWKCLGWWEGDCSWAMNYRPTIPVSFIKKKKRKYNLFLFLSYFSFYLLFIFFSFFSYCWNQKIMLCVNYWWIWFVFDGKTKWKENMVKIPVKVGATFNAYLNLIFFELLLVY